MIAILRLCLACLALVLGLGLGTTVIAAAGPPHPVAFGAAAVCYGIGLGVAQLALQWRATLPALTVRRRVLFPLVFAALAETFMLLGMPWPPTRAELTAFGPLAAALVLTLVAMGLAMQHRPQARWPLAVLALWGGFLLVRVFWRFDVYSAGQGGPGFAISILLVLTLSLTLIAAYVGGRPWWTPARAAA